MVGTFFSIFKGNAAIKGEQSFMCGAHCLDLRYIHFYKISSKLFDDKRKGPCHIVSFFQSRHITNDSKTLCDKRKFLLISINCQEKKTKSTYIMVDMVTIKNNVNFKMTTYLGLQA